MLGSDEIAMSDSESPQQNPEYERAGDSFVGGPAIGPLQQPGPIPAPSAIEPQGANGGARQATPPRSRRPGLGRAKRLARSPKGVWAAVAVLCIAAGTVGSLLGAHAVARTDAAKARLAFHLTSTGIASTLKLAIQHEEDLAISASAFFAGDPEASPAEFDAWVKSVQALRRYPELDRLGLVALVPASELAAFEARVADHGVKPLGSVKTLGSAAPGSVKQLGSVKPVGSVASVKPLGSLSAAPGGGGLRIIPAGKRPYYCLSLAGLAKAPATYPPAGTDYCALTPGLLASRDSGLSIYAQASVGRTKALGVDTPVYSGGAQPSTAAARMGAFVGWLREVLVPRVVLQRALRGHQENAVRLRYRTRSSNVVFTSGTPQPGAQSRTINLHNGWTVKTFGAAAGAGVLADGHALVLLIAGSLLSVLIGLLVFVLGTGRARALTRAPEPRALPHEDLYDALTGLPNRALMLDRADRMLARAGRQPGMLAGALFIDIDGFKEVNDKLGRAAGDQLLTIVAERLQGVARTQDTVGRLGGDEFVVLVESAARGVRLDSLARRMIDALHKPVELDGVEPSFFLTASIGVAFGRYVTPDDLLRDAHLALYAAKAAGKDRYTVFNANMRSVIEGRGVLEAELHTALQDKQFFLLYQPIYDLSTRKVVGLEALIRWQRPTQGALQPADFIPLAEETGLIVPIGRWMLEEACSRAAAWNVAGHRVGISVKVSANQLNRDGFITDVRRALQQSGVEPSLVTLEIAEATVMRDVTAAARRFGELKQLGVRIAIDDFGSGYAYHSHLQGMPLDFLKVDRSSLAASDDEDYRSALLEASLGVGRDLSLTVIAKGVETYEQMTTLQALGCAMAQGFFLGKPTPADAVEGLFHADFPTARASSDPSVLH